MSGGETEIPKGSYAAGRRVRLPAGAEPPFAIYAVNSPLIGSKMLGTLPAVVYGIFRYLYLIYDRSDDRSIAAMVSEDRGMIAAAGSFVLIAFLVLYVFN